MVESDRDCGQRICSYLLEENLYGCTSYLDIHLKSPIISSSTRCMYSFLFLCILVYCPLGPSPMAGNMYVLDLRTQRSIVSVREGRRALIRSRLLNLFAHHRFIDSSASLLRLPCCPLKASWRPVLTFTASGPTTGGRALCLPGDPASRILSSAFSAACDHTGVESLKACEGLDIDHYMRGKLSAHAYT